MFNISKGLLVYYRGNQELVKLPENCTEIYSGAFMGKERVLKSVVFPELLEIIPSKLFYKFYKLQHVFIRGNVKRIEDSAFEGCSSLCEINFPESLVSIGKLAFSGCTNLNKVEVPEGVATIEDFAFMGCYTLNKIILPKSLDEIGDKVFHGTHADIHVKSLKTAQLLKDKNVKNKIVLESDSDKNTILEVKQGGKNGALLEEKETRKQLLEKLQFYGFEYFLHTTCFDNFLKIYQMRYLLPRATLKEKNIDFTDNAHPDIIEKTEKFVLRCNRFYYRPKTPTNYAAMMEFGQKKSVILAFDSSLMYDNLALFSNGNARANATKITRIAKEALEFPWDYIFYCGSPYSMNTTVLVPPEYLKRWQQAEFLYEGPISINHLRKVYFCSEDDLEKAWEILGEDERFEVRKEYFFRG